MGAQALSGEKMKRKEISDVFPRLENTRSSSTIFIPARMNTSLASALKRTQANKRRGLFCNPHPRAPYLEEKTSNVPLPPPPPPLPLLGGRPSWGEEKNGSKPHENGDETWLSPGVQWHTESIHSPLYGMIRHRFRNIQDKKSGFRPQKPPSPPPPQQLIVRTNTSAAVVAVSRLYNQPGKEGGKKQPRNISP